MDGEAAGGGLGFTDEDGASAGLAGGGRDGGWDCPVKAGVVAARIPPVAPLVAWEVAVATETAVVGVRATLPQEWGADPSAKGLGG